MAKIAIVTGATGGLGQEFIKEIQKIDEIDEIWAVGRNEKKLEELRKKYSIIRPVIADFSTDGVEVIKQKIQKELRANIDDVRFLINNAGIGYMGHFDKQGTEDIEKLCKINCSAPAALMSLCIPYMKRGAKIINVSSASSFQPNPYLSMYSASKVFLKNLSRAVSVELKNRGITVTCVCPGWIDTEMLPDEKDGEKIHYTGKISAEKVVKKAMRDCLKGKDISTPGAFASYFRIYSKYTPTKIVMKQWVKAIRRYVA